MNIICVYKSGGDYDARYVEALSESLKKHCPIPYTFYCLTDRPKEVESFSSVVELVHNWPGWWSKIELFRPDISLQFGTTLYFDLDVLILRTIRKLVMLCFEADQPLMLRSADRVGKENDWPSSSIMSWKDLAMSDIYEELVSRGLLSVIDQMNKNIARAGQRTDQGFIRSLMNPEKFQDYLPNNYIIYKYPDYMLDPKLLSKAHILNWTGKPRYHNMLDTSYTGISNIWKSYQINT